MRIQSAEIFAYARIVSDDIVRLFLDWIEAYHEAHFAVIREIHKNQGPTAC
jgi:hypothetical protein